MFRNYFKTALRTFFKNRTTSFINVIGLSIGMTAAVFIFLWVQNELSFNHYQPAAENIFRITDSLGAGTTEVNVWDGSPMLMAESAAREIPDIEQTARVAPLYDFAPPIIVDHKPFSENSVAYADRGWFTLFHYDFLVGSAQAFNQNPFSVILTESKAKKYFGGLNALGQSIQVDSTLYTVQGIVRDNPVNSSFQFDVIIQVAGYLSDPKRYKNDQSWNNFGYMTFVKLRPDAKISAINRKLTALIHGHRPFSSEAVFLRPLKEIYFEQDITQSALPHGNPKTALIFSLLGVLLLITACINYVNLSTARSSLRAKEVSVRKIVGAQRSNLFLQFMAESLTVSIIALVFTLLLLRLFLPVFNGITEKNFGLPLSSLTMWRVLLGTLLVTTILNGLYPAALLSSFQPLQVFRGRSILRLRDGAVRKGLVVFQFSLSMVLVMGALVVYRQLHFIQHNNPGYSVSQVISVDGFRNYYQMKADQRRNLYASLKTEFLRQSSIEAVSCGGQKIVNITGWSSGNADWEGHDTAYNPKIATLSVDPEFRQLFGLSMSAGRWFRPGAEDQHNYILNQTAAREFNIRQPVIGQLFVWGGDSGRIVGVVKDFYYKSFHEKIGPMVIRPNEGSDSYFFLKTRPGNVQRSLSDAAAVWARFAPEEPFTYSFLDDSFNELYKKDILTSRLVLSFSLLAIFIAALGLFGLAAFSAEQRTKEIGIRKILGASVRQIAGLLSKEFLLLVLLAILLASPLAWWLTNKWLEDFAYRIQVNAWSFIAAGALALLVALLSVSLQAMKAARANPVKSLRAE